MISKSPSLSVCIQDYQKTTGLVPQPIIKVFFLVERYQCAQYLRVSLSYGLLAYLLSR